jgi:hypothetical protein
LQALFDDMAERQGVGVRSTRRVRFPLSSFRGLGGQVGQNVRNMRGDREGKV